MLLQLLFAGSLVAQSYGQTVPEQVLVIDQTGFNALPTVPPPSVSNLTSVRGSGHVSLLQSVETCLCSLRP